MRKNNTRINKKLRKKKIICTWLVTITNKTPICYSNCLPCLASYYILFSLLLFLLHFISIFCAYICSNTVTLRIYDFLYQKTISLETFLNLKHGSCQRDESSYLLNHGGSDVPRRHRINPYVVFCPLTGQISCKLVDCSWKRGEKLTSSYFPLTNSNINGCFNSTS